MLLRRIRPHPRRPEDRIRRINSRPDEAWLATRQSQCRSQQRRHPSHTLDQRFCHLFTRYQTAKKTRLKSRRIQCEIIQYVFYHRSSTGMSSNNCMLFCFNMQKLIIAYIFTSNLPTIGTCLRIILAPHRNIFLLPLISLSSSLPSPCIR